MVTVKDFLHGIKGAGTDIAENDTDGADRQRRQGFMRMHDSLCCALGALDYVVKTMIGLRQN